MTPPVRVLAAALLLLPAASCSGFAPATREQIELLGLDRGDLLQAALVPKGSSSGGPWRCKVRMNLVSPWLSGDFQGVVIARSDPKPSVRAQFFGDLGPKAIDLAATPDRIVGYFPQIREGVDCRLPEEAAPHPLLFLGASLLEQFVPVTRDRVLGVRPEGDGLAVRLAPVVPGMESIAFIDSGRFLRSRRFEWMYGLGWMEAWSRTEECVIEAPRVRIAVRLLEVDPHAEFPPALLQLSLAPDVRIVAGSRR